MKISTISSVWLEKVSLSILLLSSAPVQAQRSSLFVPNAPAQLASNSTRVMVGTGDAISIVEFAIQGNQPKKIVVRGIGPSLAMHGIPNALQDPVLSLYNGNGVLLVRNDNWRDTQAAEIEATALAPTDNRESAIIATLAPGTYAVALVGKSHTTGIGINEIYDLEPQDSAITGIGARGNALPDPGFFISGFFLQGNQPQTVLLRALGPSLQGSGVAGALSDPTITLRNGSGTAIASNDNWRDTQAAEIEATGLAPADNRESAILTTLTPGNYVLTEDRNSGIVFGDEYTLPHFGNPLNPVPHLITSALAVSRKTHGATAYDVALPLSGPPGVECRSGGANNAYRVVLTFPYPVTFGGAAVTSGVGSVTSATGSSTNIAIVNLTGVLSGQTIRITLSHVDDGTTANDLVVPMSVLLGDTNANSRVNATDISSTKSQSGHAVTSSNFRKDLNADGSINGSDVSFVKSKSGTALTDSGR
jgi:hypothetical protein